MSNFDFIQTEFRTIAESAARAEGHIMGRLRRLRSAHGWQRGPTDEEQYGRPR